MSTLRQIDVLPRMKAGVNRLELSSVFALSAAALGVQVVWTRIFSFMIWYHFGFLVISVAMLGFTAGGLALQMRPRWLERDRPAVMFRCALGFGLTVMFGLLVILNMPFDAGVLDDAKNFSFFVLMIVIVAAEFFFAGLFVAFAITTAPDRVARIYLANMTGSGAGCALSIVLLDRVLPSTAHLVFALLAIVAGALLLPLLITRRREVWATVAVAVLVIGSIALSTQPLAGPFYIQSRKDFPGLSRDQIIERVSSSLGIVDFFRKRIDFGLWGLSVDRYRRDHPERPDPQFVGFSIDGWALTFTYHSDKGDILNEPVFDYLPSTLAYRVAAPKDALVIGSGGGIDVVTALRNGATKVTAVEINPGVMHGSRDQYAEFNHRILHRPGVTPVVAEGRGFLSAAGERQWDLIQLSGVDTLAATQAGAFALNENYLYTRDAFKSYYDHLTPRGHLTLTRWIYNPERQTIRLLAIADAALRARGIRDTVRHVMLIADKELHYSVFLSSLTPFTPEDSQKALAACERYDWTPLVLPGITLPENQWQQFMTLDDKSQFIAGYPLDVSVTTDDRPFFMEYSKWTSAWKYPDGIFNRKNAHVLLLATTLVVACFASVFILVPARLTSSTAGETAERWPVLLLFSCLGLGYVLVEIVLVQKLTLYLGIPSYALAVVLCALLVFSGLGSLMSAALPGRAERRLGIACGSIVVVLVVYRLFVDLVLHATMGLSLSWRIALVLLLLALPATLMGIPFPTAVSSLARERRQLVVAGWVVNGYFSVLASCLAIVLSISFGFGVVLLVGAATYLVAAIASRRANDESQNSTLKTQKAVTEVFES
jgi:hypothetical protein